MRTEGIAVVDGVLGSAGLSVTLMGPCFGAVYFALLLPVIFTTVGHSLLAKMSFTVYFVTVAAKCAFSVARGGDVSHLFNVLPIHGDRLIVKHCIFILTVKLLSLVVSLVTRPLILGILNRAINMFSVMATTVTKMFLFTLCAIFRVPKCCGCNSVGKQMFVCVPITNFLIALLLLSGVPTVKGSVVSIIRSSPVLLIFLTIFTVIIVCTISVFLSVQIVGGGRV